MIKLIVIRVSKATFMWYTCVPNWKCLYRYSFVFKTTILIQDCGSVKRMQNKCLELPPEAHGSLSRSSGDQQRGTETVKGLEIDFCFNVKEKQSIARSIRTEIKMNRDVDSNHQMVIILWTQIWLTEPTHWTDSLNWFTESIPGGSDPTVIRSLRETHSYTTADTGSTAYNIIRLIQLSLKWSCDSVNQLIYQFDSLTCCLELHADWQTVLPYKNTWKQTDTCYCILPVYS